MESLNRKTTANVIQIYKSKEFFYKSTYTPENRKLFHDLDKTFYSTQGFLDNESLVLPIDYKNHPDIKTADLIIIQDIVGWESFIANKHLKSYGLHYHSVHEYSFLRISIHLLSLLHC